MRLGGSRVAFVLALASYAFGLAALFHLFALVFPRIAEPSPWWRHLSFVVVNAALAYGLRCRPRWFVYAFGLFTAQQLYAHGAQALRLLRDEHRVDWASMLVLVCVPGVLGLLIVDRRARATGC